MTLFPGDLILTGTPAGVGLIHPGDEIETRVEGIGSFIRVYPFIEKFILRQDPTLKTTLIKRIDKPMKPSFTLTLLLLLTLPFLLIACGPGVQPAEPTTLPIVQSVQSTITASPQPSQTPLPTEIPLPEGAEELVSRLGEGVSVFNYEGEAFELIYNETVIGILSADKLIYCPGAEIIKVSMDSLEILDGRLVSIDREKTEEMGVDWVEQVWTVKGERVAVPEPVVGLPEIYGETLVVQEKSLDYFMPKLLAAEKKYLDENEWIKDGNWASINFPTPKLSIGLPYVERWFKMNTGFTNDRVGLSSWTRVQMDSGKMLDLIGAPFLDDLHTLGTSEGDQNYYIWHFVFDGDAAKNWGAKVMSETNNENLIFEKKTRPEYMFEIFRGGQELFMARTFIDAREVSGWEEEYGWTENRVLRFILQGGFEDIDILMRRMIENVPNHGEVMGKQMIYIRQEGGVQIPEGFLEKMEEQLIPALMILGEAY